MLTRTTTLVVLLTCLGPALAGQPEKKGYPFQVPPPKAFAVLARLDKVSGSPITLTEDERALFADIAGGKLDKWSFGDVCLVASGVTDSAKRQEYARKLDELEAEVRKAVADTKTTHEKGKKLLEFIHAGPMAKGYSSHQTYLHTILDDGKFNCVSSAVLYNVLGRRLDLDLWAVEIPGHVFSLLLYDDKRTDVETTNKLGFDAKRDKATGAKLKKPDGEAYDPDKHEKLRRKVGELGLAAIIYYNRGVKYNEDKKFHEAAFVNLCALSLDSTNEHAAQNALAAITNWGNKLSESGKFEDALVVIEVGLELKPADSGLKNNYKVAWHKYAEAEMKAGKDEAALAVIRRTAQAVPGDEFVKAEAHLFMQSGEKLMQDKKWEDALKYANGGLEKIGGRSKDELKKWRNGVYLRWSQEFSNKAEYEKSLAILKQGIGADPKFSTFTNNSIAVYDQWAGDYMKKKDWPNAIKVYQDALTQFPGNGHLKSNLKYCEQEAKR